MSLMMIKYNQYHGHKELNLSHVSRYSLSGKRQDLNTAYTEI